MERFIYGAFGSLLPDCILFYSKRFTAPLLSFDIIQYAAVVTIYALAAGLVANIFPYRGHYTPWKAVVVGVTLPFIVAGIIAVADKNSTGKSEGGVVVRGPEPSNNDLVEKVPGGLIDLMAGI